MTAASLKSLRVQLALRLAAIYVVATAIAVGVLIYQAYDTADSLNDRELSLRAADLAGHVTVDPSGVARLELPTALAASYQASGNADIFAIRRGVDAIVMSCNGLIFERADTLLLSQSAHGVPIYGYPTD